MSPAHSSQTHVPISILSQNSFWTFLIKKNTFLGEVVALWLESWTRNPKVMGLSLGTGRNSRWGSEFTALSSIFNTMTEVPLSKAPNPQLLPGCHSINGCPLLRVCVHGVCVFTAVCVCVHFGWVNCRAQIPSMGHHTWPYVTSLSLLDFNLQMSKCSTIDTWYACIYECITFIINGNSSLFSHVICTKSDFMS